MGGGGGGGGGGGWLICTIMIIKDKLIKAHFNLLQDEIQHCCNINCKRVITKQHVHSCIQMDLLPEGGGGSALY